MNENVEKELAELIDELVAKAGPTTGQVKANQDPDKVARLIELGWTPAEKKSGDASLMSPIGYIQERLKKIEETLTEHDKAIHQCSIQR